LESPVGSSVRLKLASVATQVSVHHLRSRTGLFGPVSVSSDWVGYHVYLRHGTSVCWHFKTRLTTTVVHSYKLLINDVKPFHSLNIARVLKFNIDI